MANGSYLFLRHIFPDKRYGPGIIEGTSEGRQISTSRRSVAQFGCSSKSTHGSVKQSAFQPSSEDTIRSIPFSTDVKLNVLIPGGNSSGCHLTSPYLSSSNSSSPARYAAPHGLIGLVQIGRPAVSLNDVSGGKVIPDFMGRSRATAIR